MTKLTKSHLAVTKVVSATSMGVSAVHQRGKLFHGHLQNTPAKETRAGVWYMFDQLEPVGHRFQSTGWPTLKCCSHNLQSAPSLRPRPTLKKDKRTENWTQTKYSFIYLVSETCFGRRSARSEPSGIIKSVLFTYIWNLTLALIV